MTWKEKELLLALLSLLDCLQIIGFDFTYSYFSPLTLLRFSVGRSGTLILGFFQENNNLYCEASYSGLPG